MRMMKRKLKALLFCSLALGSICANHLKATPVVSQSISVADLNGTNGNAFYSSADLLYWGNGITFFSQAHEDWLAMSGHSNDFILRAHQIHVPAFDCTTVDGTNGFKIKESIGGLSGLRPHKWKSGTYLAGVSGTLEEYTQLPIVLLSTTNDFYSSEVSLTDSVWTCSMRVYLSNAPSYLTHARMIGDFFSSGYGFAAYSYPDRVFTVNVNEITNGPVLMNINSSKVVRFTSSGWPGYSLTSVGDINADDRDDLLIGTFNNDECWLVFGDRNWSNEVQLTNIGTNGTRFKSMFFTHPMYDPPIVGRIVKSMGDMNDDNLSDFAYSDYGWDWDINNNDQYIAVVFGKANWGEIYYANNLNGFNGFKIQKKADWIVEVAGNGDVNGDGHEDMVFLTNGDNQDVYILYGGPSIKPVMMLENEVTGTNGFRIAVYDNFGFSAWHKADINGDANGDGYSDILFAVGGTSRPTNYAWLVYGGQSPSAPPALRTPLWINVGESNSLLYELEDIPTNIVWTGCKKGDDYTFCYTNGSRCAAWDIPMDVLWFTNSYTISSADEVFSVSYTSTNALGPAAGYTTLSIQPVPEPVKTSIVALAAALLARRRSKRVVRISAP